MLECGARFSNDLYIKTSLNPSDDSCTVELEKIVEGEKVITTGTVTWSEG